MYNARCIVSVESNPVIASIVFYVSNLKIEHKSDLGTKDCCKTHTQLFYHELWKNYRYIYKEYVSG